VGEGGDSTKYLEKTRGGINRNAVEGTGLGERMGERKKTWILTGPTGSKKTKKNRNFTGETTDSNKKRGYTVRFNLMGWRLKQKKCRLRKTR